tara:strand:- start:892 stop:1848 length:957 start_codon:yes stop_codon:yes gene_type:complete
MNRIKLLTTTLTIGLLVLMGILYQPDLPVQDVDTKYSNETSRFLTLTNGNRIHYRDQGNPSSRAIILIHGFTSSLHTWEGWVALLKKEFRLITLDLPGHGLTGAVTNNDYSTRSINETIKGVADALSLDTFVLGGNSMGGGATWQFALTYPERVSHMILINSVAPWSEEDNERTNRRNNPFTPLEWKWFRGIAEYINPKYFIKRGLKSAYNNAPILDEDLIDRYLEMMLRDGTRTAIFEQMAQRRISPLVSGELQTLTQPTLVIWGALDALIPLAVGKRFIEELPNASLIVHPELGHIPMEEDPSQTVIDVQSFLSNN